MKVAIVHDYLNQYGGAEKVIEVFHELFPEAPIFTSIYDQKKLPGSFKNMRIFPSFMQKFPFLDKNFKKYLLFYPKAIESFNLSEFDVILSSSSAFAKGSIKSDKNCHICYCYTPMRFVWDYENYIQKENFGYSTKKILSFALKRLKKWDLYTLNRVDYFIAISNYIKDRIKKVYDIDSVVIYPPVNVKEFRCSEKIENYFLIVSRLNPYKNIDLAVDVFNEMNLNLKIVGTGPYKETLERLAKTKKIEFLGRLSNYELKEVYSKCRAYIFPGKEDFGISPVEAQASGRPVIAFAAGGALETILDGKTGLFFRENSRESLIKAIQSFINIENKFDSKKIIKNAMKFDKAIFKDRILNYVNQKYYEYFNKP